MSEKDAYLKKMQAQLEQWDAEIDKLRAKAKGMQADAQLAHEQQLKELRAKRREAVAKMDEMREANESAWHDMKAGIENSWSSFQEAIKKAMARFK